MTGPSIPAPKPEKPKAKPAGCLGAIILGALTWWGFSSLVDASRKHASHTDQVATPAIAGEGLYKKNEAEAALYLSQCKQSTPADRGVCILHRHIFVEYYVKAKGGQYYYAIAIANLPGKRTPYRDQTFNGVPYNPSEECAWRHVAALDLPAPDRIKQADRASRAPTRAGQTRTDRRAEQIRATTDPRAAPPAGWRPVLSDN